jgi:Sulfatase
MPADTNFLFSPLQHPPRIAAEPYLQYYLANQEQMWIPPSLNDPMNYSAYEKANEVKYVNDTAYEMVDEGFVRDFTAVYYAMIEEVDTHIGRILARLKQSDDVYQRTLVVFTSDHGEMMGSHGTTGKGNMLEESIRVPLIVAHPTKIPAGQEVTDPVSHLDLVSTVLDYVNGPAALDESDGTSLRRFVERTSYNAEHDEGSVVVEGDSRRPISSTEFAPRELGMMPNFMVRHGSYKLMLPRSADSTILDMLYDVEADPYEMNNLLGTEPDDPVVIGKAEHLKILLVEWMERHDTEYQYFSSNVYHAGQGTGDVAEIRSRRTWAALPYWQSDSTLRFGAPVRVDGQYRRNEYLYVGGTSDLEVTGASVEGNDASYFAAEIDPSGDGGYVRIKVAFVSSSYVSISSLDAWVVVANTATEYSIIPIEG